MSRNKGKQEERRKIQIDVTEDARLRLEAILERTPTLAAMSYSSVHFNCLNVPLTKKEPAQE